MNCYNYNCPFRANKTTNLYYCECIFCPNRTEDYIVYTSNHTLSADEIARIRNKDNFDYGVGVYS